MGRKTKDNKFPRQQTAGDAATAAAGPEPAIAAESSNANQGAFAGSLVPFGHGRTSLTPDVVGQPPVLSSAPTPLALLVALRRRWILALTLGVLGAVVGTAGGWLFFPVAWRASTSLHISSNRPFILFETPEGRTEFGNYQRSQVALVRSRLVLGAALRNPAVAALPYVQEQSSAVEWLEKELKVDFAAGSENLTMSMSGDNPDLMTKVVNAVRNSYMKEIVNKEQNTRLKLLDQLQKLYVKYDDLLRDKQKVLKELAEKLGSKESESLQVKAFMVTHQLGKLQDEVMDLQKNIRKRQIELEFVENKYAELEKTWKDPQKIDAAARELVEDKLKFHPDVVVLQAAVTASEKRITALKARLLHPDTDPIMLGEKRTLTYAQEAVEARREELRPAILKDFRELSLSKTAAEKVAQQEQLIVLQNLEKSVTDQLNRQSRERQFLGKDTVNLEFLREDIAHTTETHKKVAFKKEALQVEIDAPSRVTLLEDGYAVQTRNKSNRVMRAAMGGVGLFALALLGIGFLEFRARRVSSFGEVAYGLGLPLVGVLPRVPARALTGRNSARDLYWQQLLGESIASTRTMLVHAARNESLRVVMITSAMQAEGKTLVSSRLAINMALAGFKTLLIDADLRRSAIHRLFDLPAAPGLSELLREEAEQDAVLHPGPLPGLTVMTAGQWDDSLVRLLAQQELGQVLDRLKEVYDFIIIDSAPVLPVNDTLLIAQHTDGILLSVLCDVSRLPMVHLAYERLAMLDTRILGAVIGGAALGGYASGYGYGYGTPTAN